MGPPPRLGATGIVGKPPHSLLSHCLYGQVLRQLFDPLPAAEAPFQKEEEKNKNTGRRDVLFVVTKTGFNGNHMEKKNTPIWGSHILRNTHTHPTGFFEGALVGLA